MVERKQGDAIIYIVSTLFFACVVGGGVFLCLYIFLPESKSASWYPFVGIVLVAIPWIFWIITYIYRCCASCCCQGNGNKVNRVHSSTAKTQSCASAGEPTARSIPLSDNEDSPLKSPNGNGDHQRQVHFGGVVVLGSDHSGDQSLHENATGYPETQHEASDNDHISAGESPLIVSDSS